MRSAALGPDVRRRVQEVAAGVGSSRGARVVARLGLAARSVFYLVLAGLVVEIALDGGRHPSQPANAHGALSLLARSTFGKVGIALAAVGFATLGVVRIAGAVRDRTAATHARVLTAAQGVFYAALTYVPVSFLLGSHSTGSESAQHADAGRLLALPGGRVLLVVIGAVVLAVCGWQIRSALTNDFEDGLDLGGCPRWVCRMVEVVGMVGIAARALVFVPIGVFLIVAAVQLDPGHARGLDAELALLARASWWGPLVLYVVAAGLVTFAVYSGFEARFRRLDRSR